ncbi:Pumilio homolog 12 [Striga hermonthica]|uniref:Pumilio homolog 12 n=1 Tax=Striga hermonthica TaxID=68872 RepID=A0A9N7R0I0_STRHE|nr:Pumilio homolog 12 [Striga hermonthica]
MDERDRYIDNLFNSGEASYDFYPGRQMGFPAAAGNGYSGWPFSYPSHTFPYDDAAAASGNSLEAEFGRLSISGRSTAAVGGGGVGFPSDIGSMQRLRAQSAARAQNLSGPNLFLGPGMGSYESSLSPFNNNLNGLNNLNQFTPNYYGRANGSSLSGLNGLSSGFRDYLPGETGPWSLRPALANGFSSSSRRLIYTSLTELRGKIALAARDQIGCRFLQSKFEEGKPEDIRLIFSEIKDSICDLMVDQFGNYLVQKFFRVCNEDQMTQLLCVLINDERKFKEICTDMHGTRAVQKLIEHLTNAEQRSLLTSVLRRITLPLVKNNNGQHVIQHCLRYFKEDNKHILNVVADNCLDVATDKSGCCVLQQCLTHSSGEPRDRLMAQITSNALILAEHPYGNYVVQYILGFKMLHVTADIMASLSGNYVSLSMNKYGSNVVEQCLKQSEGDQALPIIEELIRSPHFLRVLLDPYGNYVAQSALMVSKGTAQHALMKLIQYNYASLHSHPHGKRVLARTKGIKLRP